jgi:hypothetical protein
LFENPDLEIFDYLMSLISECALRCLPFTIIAGSLRYARIFQNNRIAHIPVAFEKYVLEPNNLWDIDFKM